MKFEAVCISLYLKQRILSTLQDNMVAHNYVVVFSIFVHGDGTLDSQSVTTLALTQRLTFDVPTFGLTVYEIDQSFYFLTSDVLYNDINEVRYCVLKKTFLVYKILLTAHVKHKYIYSKRYTVS